MKRISSLITFLMLVSLMVWGCQKNEQINSPNSGSTQTATELQPLMTGFAKILLDGEADCSGIAIEMAKYIDGNAETWRNAMAEEIIRRVDGGQGIEEATEETFKFPPSIEKEMEKSKCLTDSDVRESIHKYEREIPRKAYEVVERHYREKSESSETP